MDDKEKDEKELRASSYAHKLSLRKQKVNEFLLKTRHGSTDKTYSVNIINIYVKPEFKEKKFNNLLDYLIFASSIFRNENSNNNDIKFAIYLLKEAKIKNQTNNEINESNILKYISNVLQKYMNDKISFLKK